MNLKYKLYGLLLTEMRNSYGLYKFQNFVKDTSKAPDQVQDIFRKDFDVSLQDFLTKFQSRHWPTATTTTPTP
jgi:hypothetical protein